MDYSKIKSKPQAKQGKEAEVFLHQKLALDSEFCKSWLFSAVINNIVIQSAT